MPLLSRLNPIFKQIKPQSLPKIQSQPQSLNFHITTKMSSNKLSISSTLPQPSGHPIPILGFGVYQTPSAIAAHVVQHALKTGYRHVDSAVGYRNEAASAQGIKASSLPRSDVFFTTKIPPGALGYESSKKHIENSLKETGFDYIDLYLIHAPYGGREARLGAWKALVEAVEAGKIRSIGVSNYGVHHLEELEQHIKDVDAKEGKGKGGVLSVNQIELHPWLARKDIVDWCQQRGVVVQAYCPIVRATKNDDPLLKPLVEKHGKTSAQILLRWSLQKVRISEPFLAQPKVVCWST